MPLSFSRLVIAAGLLTLPLAAAQAAAVSAPVFVMKAGAGDLYEKESSQLVLASTKNPKVQAFADMMVKDHATTTAAVKKAATDSGLAPKPPKLDAAQTKMIASLHAAKGPARDTLYLDQQATAHQQALMLHREYSTGGDKPALKAAAASAVPIVEHHIAMLKAM